MVSKERLLLWGGVGVSVFCLFLVLRSVPIADLAREFGRIQWMGILPALALFYLGLSFRGERWWWLMGNAHRSLRRRVLLEGVFVGYAFNNILPSGRVGEIARAVYVAKKARTPIAVIFGTIVNDRVFDSLAILLLVGATSYWILPIDPTLSVSFGGFEIDGATLNPVFANVMVGSLGVVGVVLLALVPQFAVWGTGMLKHFPFVPVSLRDRLVDFFLGVVRGLTAIKDLRRLGWVILTTVLIWGINALAALALTWAIPGLSMTAFQAVALMAIVAVIAAIPAAPGFWGLYEAGMIFCFQLLDIHEDPAVALAYGVTMHLIYYLPTTLFGLVLAFRSAIRVGTSVAMTDPLSGEPGAEPSSDQPQS